jgi:hypothetical protein
VPGGVKKDNLFKRTNTSKKKVSHETWIYVEHENRKPLFTTDSKIIFGENFPT